jgi:hypothetical protein
MVRLALEVTVALRGMVSSATVVEKLNVPKLVPVLPLQPIKQDFVPSALCATDIVLVLTVEDTGAVPTGRKSKLELVVCVLPLILLVLLKLPLYEPQLALYLTNFKVAETEDVLLGVSGVEDHSMYGLTFAVLVPLKLPHIVPAAIMFLN